jgi:hypothetical protein
VKSDAERKKVQKVISVLIADIPDKGRKFDELLALVKKLLKGEFESVQIGSKLIGYNGRTWLAHDWDEETERPKVNTYALHDENRPKHNLNAPYLEAAREAKATREKTVKESLEGIYPNGRRPAPRNTAPVDDEWEGAEEITDWLDSGGSMETLNEAAKKVTRSVTRKPIKKAAPKKVIRRRQ